MKRTHKRSRADICFACALDAMTGFNSARKAAWLKSTKLECASDRKDSQMLLRSIRESKRKWRKEKKKRRKRRGGRTEEPKEEQEEKGGGGREGGRGGKKEEKEEIKGERGRGGRT